MTLVCYDKDTRVDEDLTPRRGTRRKVSHLFWINEARAASEMGVAFPAICGVWIQPIADKNNYTFIEDSGTRASDCGNCVRIYQARLRNGLCS